MRMVGAALIAGTTLGCSGTAADHQAGDEQPRHRVVECREAILVVPEPGPGYTAYGADGGFIALPSGALQRGRAGSAGSGYEDYRFSKFGLVVRRSRQASLEIVSAPGNAFLDYGQGEFGSAHALTAGPCDPPRPRLRCRCGRAARRMVLRGRQRRVGGVARRHLGGPTRLCRRWSSLPMANSSPRNWRSLPPATDDSIDKHGPWSAGTKTLAAGVYDVHIVYAVHMELGRG